MGAHGASGSGDSHDPSRGQSQDESHGHGSSHDRAHGQSHDRAHGGQAHGQSHGHSHHQSHGGSHDRSHGHSHGHSHKNRAGVRVLVITSSDTRNLETDESGRLAEDLLRQAGHVAAGRVVVPDEPEQLLRVLRDEAARVQAEAVIVNGGTGISRRDSTYDALEKRLEKRLDGFGELFRMLSYADIGAAAMLSRATAGVADGRLIFSVPGSPGAVRLAMEKLILPELGHALHELTR